MTCLGSFLYIVAFFMLYRQGQGKFLILYNSLTIENIAMDSSAEISRHYSLISRQPDTVVRWTLGDEPWAPNSTIKTLH